MMNKTIVFSLFFVLTGFAVVAQSLPIVVDGLFEDWKNPFVFKDNVADGPKVDFHKVSISNNLEYLFLRLKVAQEVELTNNNKITLYLDTDNNALTGTSYNGIGAELRINFGDRNAVFYQSGFSIQVSLNAIKMRSLPNFGSTDFEIALKRDVKPDGKNFLFNGNTIKLGFKDNSQSNGDSMPDSGLSLSYTFDNTATAPFLPIGIEKTDTRYLRIVAYNTYWNGLDDLKRVDQFKRIIRSLNPDIITFNECWDVKPTVVASFMNGVIPLPNFQDWHTVKLDAGNITASRFPILQSWEIRPGSRLTASLIDLPSSYATDVLVVNAHLRCCTDDNGRQLEADAFVKFILDAKSPGGVITLNQNTPIVLSGDLNLVGRRQQLTTLLTGQIINTAIYGQGGPLDWDGSNLKDIVAPHTDQALAYTWKDETSEFPPSRLDYHIYTGSAVGVAKSFTLETESMTAKRLATYGLEKNDTYNASDHLPKVTDFILPMATSSYQESDDIHVQVFPNPFSDELRFIFSGFEGKPVMINLSDAQGRLVIKNQNWDRWANEFNRIETTSLPPGVYFIGIISGKSVIRKKAIKQ